MSIPLANMTKVKLVISINYCLVLGSQINFNVLLENNKHLKCIIPPS